MGLVPGLGPGTDLARRRGMPSPRPSRTAAPVSLPPTVLLAARRGRRELRWLAATTASVAGLVNVVSVMAFFAFASNVTGHVAVFAQRLLEGELRQVAVVGAWVTCFVMGAFVGNLLVTGIGGRPGRAAPAVLEIGLLVAVGTYGATHYASTLVEAEVMVGVLLFAMGNHNGTVATVSDGVVKTTHLTGLSTNLGMGLSQLVQGQLPAGSEGHFRLGLELTILASYVGGGLVGGALFTQVGFGALLVGALVLGVMLANDATAGARDRRSIRTAREGESAAVRVASYR